MSYDERDYPEPGEFKPERFLRNGQLDSSVRDPIDIAFGFGRRWAICSTYLKFLHPCLILLFSSWSQNLCWKTPCTFNCHACRCFCFVDFRLAKKNRWKWSGNWAQERIYICSDTVRSIFALGLVSLAYYILSVVNHWIFLALLSQGLVILRIWFALPLG